MTRSIRRVPPGWEHPRSFDHPGNVDGYIPLLGEDYAMVLAEWQEGKRLWDNGSHPQMAGGPLPDSYEEAFGPAPRMEEYMPALARDEASHFQAYEEVTEGTPISPVLPSIDAVIKWLCTHKDYMGYGPWSRDDAEALGRGEIHASFRAHGPEAGPLFTAVSLKEGP